MDIISNRSLLVLYIYLYFIILQRKIQITSMKHANIKYKHTYIISEMYNKTIFLQSAYLLKVPQFNFSLKRFSYKYMYSSEELKRIKIR